MGWNDRCQRTDSMIAPWAIEEVAHRISVTHDWTSGWWCCCLTLGSRPNLSIPAACGGRAEIKAAYRFFDNDKATFEKVIEPHIANSKSGWLNKSLCCWCRTRAKSM